MAFIDVLGGDFLWAFDEALKLEELQQYSRLLPQHCQKILAMPRGTLSMVSEASDSQLRKVAEKVQPAALVARDVYRGILHAHAADVTPVVLLATHSTALLSRKTEVRASSCSLVCVHCCCANMCVLLLC